VAKRVFIIPSGSASVERILSTASLLSSMRLKTQTCQTCVSKIELKDTEHK
jgi:hypothetical protein